METVSKNKIPNGFNSELALIATMATPEKATVIHALVYKNKNFDEKLTVRVNVSQMQNKSKILRVND